MNTAPRTSVRSALADAVRTMRLLVLMDFDGTLSEIAEHPDAARPIPGALESLCRLAACDRTSVAVISGRARNDLITRLGRPAGVQLFGCYGADQNDVPPLVSAEECNRLDTIAAAIKVRFKTIGLCEGMNGIRVERKPLGVALHTRGLDDATRMLIETESRTIARAQGIHTERRGHRVLEFSLTRAGKGRTAWCLAAEQRADAVIAFGDDESDEEIFALSRAGWCTVRVDGPDSPPPADTAAHFHVPGPREAVDLLLWLANVREDALQTRTERVGKR